MDAASSGVEVARADLKALGLALQNFLASEKHMLLLVFEGDPNVYVDMAGDGECDVVVFKSPGRLSRTMERLYSYVYGLGSHPVFPCAAILLSRKAAEFAAQSGGKGYIPIIRAIRMCEAQYKNVRYISLSHGAVGGKNGFSFLTFLVNVLLPGLLDSSLLRFLLVGLSGVFVNLAVLDAQVVLLGLYSKSYLAVPLAFECSTIWNFALNNRYTFRAGGFEKMRFVEYNASTLGSFLTQLASVYALTTHAHIHYIVASVVGIILGFFVNYTLSLWIWRKPQSIGPRY